MKYEYEEATQLPTPGYVGGSLGTPSGPSINCEAWTDMGNPVPPWARGIRFKDGIKFDQSSGIGIDREYLGPQCRNRLLLRVGYDTSNYHLLHAAWFLITTALKRMVSR